MFKTSHENKMVEVLTGAEQRRRRTPQEKIAIVQQSIPIHEAAIFSGLKVSVYAD